MKPACSVLSLGAAAALAAILGWLPAPAGASQTDIAQVPLGTGTTGTVLPNLMFILDNSSSMRADRMPDEVNESTTCKACTSSSCNVANTSCARGHPPYYAAPFNTLYYNPQITYTPAVNYLGASLGNSDPTAANSDPYLGGSNANLTTSNRDIYWCTTSSPTSTQLTDPNVCRRNGINTPNPFVYKALSSGTDFTGGLPTTTFRNAVTKDTLNPFYYEITPREHCTDVNLSRCTLSDTPVTISGTGFLVPAPVRFCSSAADAASTSAVSDTPPQTPKCQSKVSSTYKYPRFGYIKRTDIVSATANYGNRPARSDCAAAPNCTYPEELQNFANWYTYYRIRASLMKTVGGQAFLALDDRFRVGFVTINVPDSNYYLKIDKFTTAHRQAWYDKFYKSQHISGTPLKEALSRAGRHYAGRIDGMNSVLIDDPVQYSCQQNFAILTTDGYYDNDPGKRIDGTTDIGNQDNVEDGKFVTRESGTFDGNLGGSGSSLADVAMYYYKTDLRPTMKDNVPTTDKDKAAHQHMVSFTLGLGLDGLMTFRPDYETATTGDFAKIKAGDPSGCSWTNKACDWPEPKSSQPTALDDLWHAAVNGRGVYFSAKEAKSLKTGLASALASIQITTGAAAASATSTPNITPTDNFIYSTLYRTVMWDGEVVAERIDASSGAVAPGLVWSAGTQLDGRVTINSDDRTIYTLAPSDPTDKLKLFLYANFTTAEQDLHFDDKCAKSALPQCPSLTPGQQSAVNSGSNLVNWLRGQSKKEDGVIFRDRQHVLGDVVNAKPAFVAEPNLLYGEATYAPFKTANAGRQAALYIAANDGMLHAFNADTGREMWAYVPRMLVPELYKLASTTYDKSHRYYVDGSPVTMDVFFASSSQWKTILVGGLNAGGRGYYALDITDPNAPKGLWEFCADPTGDLQCTSKDDNVGLAFGQPIITKRPTDGRWVVIVSSGYNNVSPGDGGGYLYVLDAETGAILHKAATDIKGVNVGDTMTPSGFAKITGFATNFLVNNTTTIVYGGDLLGNVWRFDLATLPDFVAPSFPIGTSKRIGEARDGAGKIQSITTRPDVTRFDAGFNVVYFGTGRLLGDTDIPDPATLVPPVLDLAYQQTVYAFRDYGEDSDPLVYDLGSLRDPAAKLVQQTLSKTDSSASRTISNNTVDWSTQNGWYVDLNPENDSPGERVSIDPQLVKGVLAVTANEPNSDACSAGGNRFEYQFDYSSGSYILSAPGGVVGIKKPALGAGFVVFRLPSGQMKYIGIDVTGKKTPEALHPGAGGAIGSRASWRELY